MVTSDRAVFSGRIIAYLHILDQDQSIQAAAIALANCMNEEVTSDSIRAMLGEKLQVSIRRSVAASTRIQMQNKRILALEPPVFQELDRCGVVLEKLMIQSLNVRA